MPVLSMSGAFFGYGRIVAGGTVLGTGSLYFDGISSFMAVDATTAALLSGTQDFTVEWFQKAESAAISTSVRYNPYILSIGPYSDPFFSVRYSISSFASTITGTTDAAAPTPASGSTAGYEVANLFDAANLSTYYINAAGAGAGVIMTPAVGSSKISSIHFTTAPDPATTSSDPVLFTLEGTNEYAPFSTSVWATLAANQSTLLPTARASTTQIALSPAPSTAFRSYRLRFPQIRNSGVDPRLQLGKVAMLGTVISSPTLSVSAAGQTILQTALPAATPFFDRWSHTALVRSSQTLRLYFDGTAVGSSVSFAATLNNSSYRMMLGFADALPTIFDTVVASSVAATTATSGGIVANEGSTAVSARGVCWSTSTGPTAALSTKTVDGSGAGTFTSALTGLLPATTYYVRAYATNGAGTSYGSQVSFTTANSLEISTLTAASIASTSMVGGGFITSVSGGNASVRGVVWSSASSTPTVALSTIVSSTGTFGTGSYTFNISTLIDNTAYYYRAFASNTHGLIYGSSFLMSTLAGLPTISTINSTAISASNTSLTSYNISNTGGISISRMGVVWNTNSTPTVALSTQSSIVGSFGIGSYSTIISPLYTTSSYWIRSFASNAVGISYGSQVQIAASQNPNSFTYADFTTTTGLILVGNATASSPNINVTSATTNVAGNVYRTTAVQYNRNFSMSWNMYVGGGVGISGSPGADGYCLQWTTTNNTAGSSGGTVSRIAASTTIHAFAFLTYTVNTITYFRNNSQISSTGVTAQLWRQSLFYWADYNHTAQTFNIFHNTVNSKPALPNYTYTGFVFDATNYFIGFGAGTGSATDNHQLRALSVIFT